MSQVDYSTMNVNDSRWKRLFGRFKRFLKTDRAALIISISIALFFWFFTKMSNDYETDRIVNINYDLPEGKTFLSEPPKNVKANIKGGGWNLLFNYIGGGLPEITIPLDENDNIQYISSTSIANKISTTVGTKYTILNVESDIITIKLDDDNAKKVPIVLDAEIKIKNGFMPADSIQLDHEFFTISGPKSLVETIQVYPTEKIMIDEISGDFSQKIKPKQPDNPQLIIEPEELILSYQVDKSTEGELFIPIEVLNAPDSIYILPKNVLIKYRAPLRLFSAISQSDFSVTATLNEKILSSGNNSLALELMKQPEFTKVISITPPTIEYYFVKEEAGIQN